MAHGVFQWPSNRCDARRIGWLHFPGLATAAGEGDRADGTSRVVGEQFRVAVRSFSGSQGRSAPAGVASRRLQGPSKARRGAEAGEAGAEHGQAGRGRCQEHEHVAASGGRERARAVSFLEASLPRLATPPLLPAMPMRILRSPCLFYGLWCLAPTTSGPSACRRQNSETWCHAATTTMDGLLSCGHGASSLRERTVWFDHGHIGVSHILKRTELNIGFTISAYLSSAMLIVLLLIWKKVKIFFFLNGNQEEEKLGIL